MFQGDALTVLRTKCQTQMDPLAPGDRGQPGLMANAGPCPSILPYKLAPLSQGKVK